MQDPERSGWQEVKSLRRSVRGVLSPFSSESGDRTTRPEGVAPLFIIITYKLQHGQPLDKSGSTGDLQSVDPSRRENDSWGQPPTEMTVVPRAHTIRSRGTRPVRGKPHSHLLPTVIPVEKQKRAMPTAGLFFL